MHDSGASYHQIAAQVDRSHVTVRYHLDPAYAEEQRQKHAVRNEMKRKVRSNAEPRETKAVIWMLRKLIDNQAFYTQTSGGGTRPKVEITFDDLEGMRRFSDALAECRLYLRDHGGEN